MRVDTGAAERITVRCNLLVYRNRGDDPSYDLYSADRRDELVAGSDGGFLVRRRWLAIDQSNMAGDSLSVFL